ncbi:hypothetical protein DRO22_04175 [Candidatus Bathyarchaeota archaeon]|nr:MAG: hypothetical protein DRO22_04175 [Candidatus Bathyarchaeota archaeon]
MIRRILDFVLVLLFMWACMILGLWLISGVIVPLELPWINNRVVTATIKVAASVGLALFWLWLWREIVKRMFWHTLRFQESRMKKRSKKEKALLRKSDKD